MSAHAPMAGCTCSPPVRSVAGPCGGYPASRTPGSQSPGTWCTDVRMRVGAAAKGDRPRSSKSGVFRDRASGRTRSGRPNSYGVRARRCNGPPLRLGPGALRARIRRCRSCPPSSLVVVSSGEVGGGQVDRVGRGIATSARSRSPTAAARARRAGSPRRPEQLELFARSVEPLAGCPSANAPLDAISVTRRSGVRLGPGG
jgi:hypothetical protein